MLEGEKALIVQHCAVAGRIETKARKFKVYEPRPYAQWQVAVRVWFVEPRMRNGRYFEVTPDDIRYMIIERDGRVLYDSRDEVPCDMAKWHECNTDNAERRRGCVVGTWAADAVRAKATSTELDYDPIED
jgi:hypothetical protein